MVRLDLGCGASTRPGFIGMDRVALPGVSVVSDFDTQPLPFKDNSFDLVLAFHSIEHASDITSLMGEIWRVVKPGGQVCIVGPYYAQHLNFANPYHKQALNEHTPRFWTSSPRTRVNPLEYEHPPQGTLWGLSRSDNSNPGFDFRCMRMEFFYFAEYWRLPEDEQRRARKKYLDVCDQIMYHLVVFKQPMSEAKLEEIEPEYYLPQSLEERREAARGVRMAEELKIVSEDWKREHIPSR